MRQGKFDWWDTIVAWSMVLGWLAVFFLLVFLLSGCSATEMAVLDAASDKAVQSAKTYEDTKAGVLLEAPCAISAGAFFRLPREAQTGVAILCGGLRPGVPGLGL